MAEEILEGKKKNNILLNYQSEIGVRPEVIDYIDEINLSVKTPIVTGFHILNEYKPAELNWRIWAAAVDTIMGALDRWEKINKVFLEECKGFEKEFKHD